MSLSPRNRAQPDRADGARIVRLTPERMLAGRLKRRPAMATDCCSKCGSFFVTREPAFLHCRYCGTLARVPNAPLADQELFELRSGLRVAS